MAAQRRGPQTLIATLLGAFAAVVIVLSTAPGATSTTTTTQPIAAPTTSSSSTTTTDRETTLAAHVLASDNTLYATINGATDDLPLRLATWSDDAAPDISGINAGAGPTMKFDASGEATAYLGTGTDEGQLFLRRGLEPWFSFHGDVSAFAWHKTEPGELAWQYSGELCRTDSGPLTEPGFECVPDSDGELIAYDHYGFLFLDTGSIVRIDLEGREVARLTADEAEVGPDGRILLMHPGEPGEVAEPRFSIAGPNLEAVEPLVWAPRNAFGEYGFVEWSSDQLLAFLRHNGVQDWIVSIYWPWGRHVSTFDLPGRFWNLTWSNNGRFLVLPGVTDEGHVVLVLDVMTGDQSLFHHPNWVQDAHLVTTRCMDASPMIDGLATYLAEQTPSSLLESKAVMSRDLGLESWLFVSATVSDGPRHGEIATWAFPGFNFLGGPAPLNLMVPANEAAEAIGPIANTYTEEAEDWMSLDGARESQACLSD